MRTKIFTAIVVSMIVLFILPVKALAGSNDTLVVYANGANLDDIINSDTTSNSQQAHSVYKLVTLDTTYIYLAQITPKSDITVLGVLGSEGRPPCIQPGVLNDGSIPTVLFNLTKNGLRFSLKNLFLEDLSTNGSYYHPGRDILASADSVRVDADNIVFDNNHGSTFAYTGNWGKFFATNCKFRNGVDPVTWTDAEGVAPVWPATPSVDTISIKYCTFLCWNSYLVAPESPVRFVEFSHNNLVFSFLQPFWMFGAFSAKVNNNILYSPFVGGETKAEYPYWDEEYSTEYPSIVSFDTMNTVADSVFDIADKGNSNWRMLAEAKRNIEIKNNVYFQPSAITAFWTAWNDTARGDDSLYTPTWMNTRTTNMFNNKTDWPGLVESGNIMDEDPGYGSSFANVITGGGTYGLGLLPYFTLIRTGQSPSTGWGYQVPTISGSNWIPAWPLPEAADMQYSNTALKTGGTDGKAIGDPGWFTNGYTGVTKTSVIVPGTFSLANAYPNPFNPTTNIKFAVAKSENITLVVFNLLGQKVKTLVNGMMKAGDYTATWDGKDEFGK
ncbi:MAG: hypothetical protein P4L45_07350, partial [Ignavibacteriaceae bacterium]|nr:hypothetical protein [Ignavibacteriaceae bacterium]